MRLCCVIAGLVAILAAGSCFADGFVKADGAGLVLNGKPYRAVGVNMPTLFSDYIAASLTTKEEYGTPEKSKQHVIDGVNDAQKSGVAFIRFWVSAYWPANMDLYFDNPKAYWQAMDEVFSMCREKKIKLVPSLFFNINMWPMLSGEDLSAILNPDSKSYKAMHKYMDELITRYKDDTNVLMWEISNECFLTADLTMEGRGFPDKIAYQKGATVIKTTYNNQDSMTSAMWKQFYIETTKYIKSLDSNHMVTSGDAGVRDCSVSLRENYPKEVWTMDTLRENIASLLSSQPEPLDVLCIHNYGPQPSQKMINDLSTLEFGKVIVRAAHAASMPIFIGELGNIEPSFKQEPTAKWTIDAINAYDKEGVDLIAIWAWWFPSQPENTFTSASHPGVAKAIAKFNKKHGAVK